MRGGRGTVLGVVATAVVLGLLGGAAAAYVDRPDATPTGVASPLPASSPSYPSDPERPPLHVLPDLDYPTLTTPTRVSRQTIGNANQRWRYVVPRGWVGQCVLDVGSVPLAQVPGCTEVRWRPPGEDSTGGYSLRVKAVADHLTPTGERDDRTQAIQDSTTLKQVHVLRRKRSAVYFSLLAPTDDGYLRRLNFFGWFAGPSSAAATLEMSVTGREVDQDGLTGLFDVFTHHLQPLPPS